ncbi:hypothetical protein HK405_002397, partial [Cladochytrium tenue]
IGAAPSAKPAAATTKRKPRPGASARSAEQPDAPRDAQPAAQWPARDVQLSHDSSPLTVAAGPLVALWDPGLRERRAILTYPPAANPLHCVAFVDMPHAVWARDPAGLLGRLRATATADGDQSDEYVDSNDDDNDAAAAADAQCAWARSAAAVLPFLVVAWPPALWPGPPPCWAPSRSLRRIARTALDVRVVADPHAVVFAIVITEP